MKRLHVHVAVPEIEPAVRFYAALFAAEPTVRETDYAKWMLDDLRVNFAISARGAAPGVEHLGIQAEDGDELREVYGRMLRADRPVLEEGHTTCCYAKSEKSWVTDPAGVAWEVFHTYGGSPVYGGGEVAVAPRLASTASTGSPLAAIAQIVVPPVAAAGCCGPTPRP